MSGVGHAALTWYCIDCAHYFDDPMDSNAHVRKTGHTARCVNMADHDTWVHDERDDVPLTRKTQLVRKAARQFRTGEVLYLFGCDTGPELYGVLRGAFVITEKKHQSDTGVSFFLRHQYVQPNKPWSGPGRSYLVEFARDQLLYRLSGTPVTFVIRELP